MRPTEERRRAQHLRSPPSGPPLVSTFTIVKPAKPPIRENSMVMAMRLRVIGKVT